MIFHCGVNVGVDKTFASLHNEFDAVLFAGGAEDPRDPEPARPGSRRRALRHALSDPAEPAHRRRGASTDEPILASRQACGGDRRRRYGLGLRRHGLPPGRALGDPARHPPEAAGARGQADGLALLADQDAHLLVARPKAPSANSRRRRSASKARRAASLACTAPASTRSASRSPAREFVLQADLVFLAIGFAGSVKAGLLEESRRRARSARQRVADDSELPHLEREGLRRRRHAPRPVAGGLGDPRGPPGRPLHRYLPDGLQHPAGVRSR